MLSSTQPQCPGWLLQFHFLLVPPDSGNSSHGKAKFVGGTEVRRADCEPLKGVGQVFSSMGIS